MKGLAFFYKAAFYDRDAFINSLTLRYHIRCDYQEDTKKNGFDQFVRVVDEKTGKILFERDGLVNTYKVNQVDREKTCKKYLKENYPDWENPLAYWD